MRLRVMFAIWLICCLGAWQVVASESPDQGEAQNDDQASADSSASPSAEIPMLLTEEFCRKKRAQTRTIYSVGDDEPFAVFRVPPRYPRPSPGRGIEGYVVLELTVRSDGRTENVRAVESSHKIFERTAIRAVEQWIYCPVFRDGVPVETKGVRTKIEFILESTEGADRQSSDD